MYKYGPYLEAFGQIILIDSFGLLAGDVPERCWHWLPTLMICVPAYKHLALNCVRCHICHSSWQDDKQALTHSPHMIVADLPQFNENIQLLLLAIYFLKYVLKFILVSTTPWYSGICLYFHRNEHRAFQKWRRSANEIVAAQRKTGTILAGQL